MCITLIALLLTLSIAVSFQQPLSSGELIPINVNVEEIQSYVKVLSGVQSRMTGYPGYYESIDYILQELKKAGLNPELHTFYTVVPYDGGSSIKLQNDYVVKAYALYPNVVALGGAKNLKGKLLYASTGDLSELDGKEIEGRIAVLEFNSQDNWLNLIQLGAKAVIFVESPGIAREEALKKITLAPLDFPRLYVCREDASRIREAAKKGLEAEININYTWRRVKAYNVIAKIEGDIEPEKVIILSAHLDSASITPALSPGAEEAVNPAFLLYIAKQLAQHRSKLKYSVWIVFFSGHWQGLSGARWFVEDYFFNESYGLGTTFYPYITLNLELSSGSSKLILNPGGAFFYGHRTVGAMNIYKYLEDSVKKWIVEFYRRYPKYYQAIASDAFNYNPVANIATTTSFRSGVSVDYALPFILDSEPFALAKSPAASFLTFKDIRLKVFTPQDRIENINWDNLKPQFAFTAYVLNKVLSDITTVLKGSGETIKPTRLEVDPANGGFGYADVRVEVLEYDPTVPTLYKPVPNALVVVYKINWYYNTMTSFAVTKYNPFAYIIDQTDENGQLKIVGLAPQEAFIGNVEILGYKVEDGHLTYVPNMGPNGFGKFSPAPPYLKPGITVKTVAFKAAGIFVPHIMLPDQPYPLITLNIYNKPVFPIPYTHYANPMPTSIEAFQENLVRPQSFAKIEDYQGKFALVFAPPEQSIQVIVSITGLQREAVMLLNITDASMMGHGYKLGPAGTLKIVPNALIEYTRELFTISKERYQRAVKQGIRDFNLEELLKTAETNLKKAEQLYAERKYSEAYIYIFKAWSSSIQLYERVRGMYVDFTNAAVVIMLIIAPFAVIFEKFLGRENGYKRIIVLIVIAAFAFSIFAILHPGFTIVYSVSALALGVILMVLVMPTLFFLYLNFNRSLGQLRRKHVGTHFLEREVFDMFIAAMSIG
ncbi:MAG TPA: M28 family peptidase, partial [Thermofilum sp.]|nr:M28 family peptidase [Thermofilum sp.]